MEEVCGVPRVREFPLFNILRTMELINSQQSVLSFGLDKKNKLQPPHLPPLYCVCGATGNHKIWFFPVVEMLYYVFPDILIYLRYIVALTVWRPTFFTSPLLLCLHVFNFFFFVSLWGFFFIFLAQLHVRDEYLKSIYIYGEFKFLTWGGSSTFPRFVVTSRKLLCLLGRQWLLSCCWYIQSWCREIVCRGELISVCGANFKLGTSLPSWISQFV